MERANQGETARRNELVNTPVESCPVLGCPFDIPARDTHAHVDDLGRKG